MQAKILEAVEAVRREILLDGFPRRVMDRGIAVETGEPNGGTVENMTDELSVRQERPEMKYALKRVLLGHSGWIRDLCVDPSDKFFVSASNDKMIKLWDMHSGKLWLSLVGHTHNVHSVHLHDQYRYLFSGGEDNAVKCWDLQSNRVIRSYHGHLSGVYVVRSAGDLLFSGSRDSSTRVWDIRSRNQVALLTGHTSTVHSILTLGLGFGGHSGSSDAGWTNSPDAGRSNSACGERLSLVTGSADSTIRVWDLRSLTSPSAQVLTHHKKGVRALCRVPQPIASSNAAGETRLSFMSASIDSFKWFSSSSAAAAQPGNSSLVHFSFWSSVDNTDLVQSVCSFRDVAVATTERGSLIPIDLTLRERHSRCSISGLPGNCGPILASAFSQDGSKLIVGGADNQIKVFFKSSPS